MVKKHILLCAFIFITGVYALAQNTYESGLDASTGDKPIAAGLGLEWNMNSRENFGAAFGLGFDYNLPVKIAPFSAGLNAIFSSNFADTGAIELSGHFRWYFMEIKGGKMNWLNYSHAGFFAQADLGIYIFMPKEDTYPLFLGGLRAGYRLPLGSCFFIEPYGRFGYPFAFGLGVMGGVRFSPAGVKKFFTSGKKQKTESNEQITENLNFIFDEQKTESGEQAAETKQIFDEEVIEKPVDEADEKTEEHIYETTEEFTDDEVAEEIYDEFTEDETEQLLDEKIIDDFVEELTEEEDE